MNDDRPFYEPADLGYFDLGITQKNKLLTFTSLVGVFTSFSKVEVYVGKSLLKTYGFADMVLTGTNVSGTSKTLIVSLDGADYLRYKGITLKGFCSSFFVDGDVEMIFKLEIK